jgi:hypothetical protein
MSGDDHVSLLCSLIKVVTSGGLQQYFESFMHSQLIFRLLEKLFYGAYIEIFLVDKAYFQCINVFLASKLGLRTSSAWNNMLLYLLYVHFNSMFGLWILFMWHQLNQNGAGLAFFLNELILLNYHHRSRSTTRWQMRSTSNANQTAQQGPVSGSYIVLDGGIPRTWHVVSVFNYLAK